MILSSRAGAVPHSPLTFPVPSSLSQFQRLLQQFALSRPFATFISAGPYRGLPVSPGWILIDRCGKHFGTILNYLRDGAVPLPESRREIEELLAEAKYYLVQGLVDECQAALQVGTGLRGCWGWAASSGQSKVFSWSLLCGFGGWDGNWHSSCCHLLESGHIQGNQLLPRAAGSLVVFFVVL